MLFYRYLHKYCTSLPKNKNSDTLETIRNINFNNKIIV